ncbi:uncharacterized protein EAE97_011468 [Botrytis byssoidea]|uniref:Uncharacterized protein n=1 Tax=Botrytis byssoidea TaxID=139641 RepID=A0A9P5HU95_9HELO|nr:uncharacterized protein EAE97_011468 [Botrytis byssoidea]KAF7920575.1 hypothetical protein EAE97_011468 [Botrytis byssoidea]
MARENQKSGRKFKPKPRRATPAERRARKEAEEARLQSGANAAAAAQAARLGKLEDFVYRDSILDVGKMFLDPFVRFLDRLECCLCEDL